MSSVVLESAGAAIAGGGRSKATTIVPAVAGKLAESALAEGDKSTLQKQWASPGEATARPRSGRAARDGTRLNQLKCPVQSATTTAVRHLKKTLRATSSRKLERGRRYFASDCHVRIPGYSSHTESVFLPVRTSSSDDRKLLDVNATERIR